MVLQSDLPIGPGKREFQNALCESDSYMEGSEGRKQYIDLSVERLYGVFLNLHQCRSLLAGPTLDVASGWGILFPALRAYFPQLMPYSIAELTGGRLHYDGVGIDCVAFECEKDTLPFADCSFGAVIFNDCLEHLIVDPIWPMLEFNRVLRPGGSLVINTPNALGAFRFLQMFAGNSPATESHIKPAAIYQRHNREWTPGEMVRLLGACGFECEYMSTYSHRLTPPERQVLEFGKERGLLQLPFEYYGPEIFVLGKKHRHQTTEMDLPASDRWPDWLYTSHEAYRRRPMRFPIVWGEDYA